MSIQDIICYRCNARDSRVTDYKSGEIVCSNCGVIFEDRIIDDTYEKRSFGNENGGNRGESRIGGPMKAGEEKNLGNTLVYYDKNTGAKKARGGNAANNQTPIERNFDEIDKILANKEIKKNIIENTKDIYSQVIKHKNMKGRNLKTMICAMYFIASRKNNLSKSFKEIANMFGIEEKKIKKAYNYIKTVIENSLSPQQLYETISNYISSFCEENSEKYEYKELSKKIAYNINETSLLEGRNTKTITGIALLIASKLMKTTNINNNSIYERFATDTTLSKVFEKIKDSLNVIIPPEYKDKIPGLSIR